MADLRTSPRRRTLLGARIEFNNRSSTMNCVVRDLSDTGARLALASAAQLPEQFDLVVEPQNRKYRATVKWKRLALVGVAFT